MNFKDYKKLKDISCCFVDDKVLEISGGWRWHDDADALICILWQISNKLLNTLHSMPQRNYNPQFWDKKSEHFLQPIILASFSEFPSVEVKLGEQLEPVSKLGPHSTPTRLPNALQPVKSYHFQLFPGFPSFTLSVVRHLKAVERLQAWHHQQIKHQHKPDGHYWTRFIYWKKC